MSVQLDALRAQLEELNQSGRVVDYDEYRRLLGQFPESITVRDLATFRAIAKRQVNLYALSPSSSGAVATEQHDRVITLWRLVDEKLGQTVAAALPPEDAANLDDLLTKADRAETLNLVVSQLATAEQQHTSVRLNGWQRLWVLFAVIWTVCMAGCVTDVGISGFGSPTSTIGWWAIPPLCLYVIGWAIAWVRRGFTA